MAQVVILRTLKEKRKIPRISCRILAASQVNERPEDIVITDLSEKGAKIETPVKLTRNHTYPLSVKTTKGVFADAQFKRNTVIIRVAWCRKQKYGKRFTAGITFAESNESLKVSWVHYILDKFGLSTDNAFRQRDSLRIFAEVPITCEVRKGEIVSGTIENISMGGLLMLSRVEIPENSLLSLSIGPYNRTRKFSLIGKAARVTAAEKPSHWLIAITFYEPGKRELDILRKLIVTIMNEEVF